MNQSHIVNTIRHQLFACGFHKVGSWGPHQWMMIDEYTLQFKVQGHHYRGHVRIEYNKGCDLYDIHFGDWHHYEWRNHETIEGIYFDEMVDVIDQKVEYIPAYQNN